jgi:hypothetical protein
VWDDESTGHVFTASATETAEPLPEPPAPSLNNADARATIAAHPELFKIVSPINVDVFESYLSDHPNQPFVVSVCRGLREGFWPWADLDVPNLPSTVDNSSLYPLDPLHEDTVRQNINTEVAAGRYSAAFGPDLLPGMFSMPLFVIPKAESDKFRVVFDHSAEPVALNSFIPRDKVSVVLDNMHDLGSALIRARATHGSAPLTLIKSDVSLAYRQLPMHPLWQIKQIVTFKKERHVDRCNIWGDRAAGYLWCSFMGLVSWIAIHIKLLEDILTYVDDIFSWDFDSNLNFYEPYEAFLPEKQCLLLSLWDELGIPHELKKQVNGTSLRIIGFQVDCVAMTITMPPTSITDLVAAIRGFARPRSRRPLRDFLRLGGWINWGLNVFPLLRPGLSTLYAKTKGKTQSRQTIWVSVGLCRELIWLADHIENLPGINLFVSREWSVQDAEVILYTDACPSGLSFWSPATNEGFQHRWTGLQQGIFYLEAFAVLSSFSWYLHSRHIYVRRIVIFTDNENTVHMFNTLHASPLLNPILLTAVDLQVKFDVQLRVFHVPGVQNGIADALSRFDNDRALSLNNKLRISAFLPPQLTMGATTL